MFMTIKYGGNWFRRMAELSIIMNQLMLSYKSRRWIDILMKDWQKNGNMISIRKSKDRI